MAVLEAMACINSIGKELDNVPEYLAKEHRDALIESKHAHGHHGHGRGRDLMDEEVETVEILWEHRIETVSFPLPRDAPYLTAKTKQDFLMKADLTSSEKRMKQLLEQSPIFEAEMRQIHLLCEWSSIYAFINNNIVTIKVLFLL